MSIPVYLEPIPLESGVTGDGMGYPGYVVEVVLDQGAIEILMDCTAVEFRDLVRVNETRAKQVKARGKNFVRKRKEREASTTT